jgi:hypothetical protein
MIQLAHCALATVVIVVVLTGISWSHQRSNYEQLRTSLSELRSSAVSLQPLGWAASPLSHPNSGWGGKVIRVELTTAKRQRDQVQKLLDDRLHEVEVNVNSVAACGKCGLF